MGDSSMGMQLGADGSGVFFGDYLHSLDPKRRLTIPSEWRTEAGASRKLFVMPDFHSRCLNVVPASVMTEKMQKIRKQSMSDRKAMEFARILGSASDLVSWDAQGRIRIKDKLLEFAGLVDRVALVGALDKFQLWNPDQLPDGGDIDQSKLSEAGRYIDF